MCPIVKTLDIPKVPVIKCQINSDKTKMKEITQIILLLKIVNYQGRRHCF